MEDTNQLNNIIRYDQAFILALKESPLVGVPDDFDNSFMYVNVLYNMCNMYV